MYLLFFSYSHNLFLAALSPNNLATQNTEVSSAICSKESFSRTTQRCQNHGGIVYKGQYTLYQHAIQLLIFRTVRVYQYKLGGSCCGYLTALRPVGPQTEAERLWSPEENSSKIKLFLCIVVRSWKRRSMPACGHHPQNTLGGLSAVSSSSFHMLNIKLRPCIHTPILYAICTAYSIFVLICYLIYVRVVCTDWWNGAGAKPYFHRWR